ncbi:NUDIX domain-containing protein [Subtercola endophyticus]|uniref:NUDIX domain-containing protein n=1 Tax=Subtercola endophyticus TaxID=2895559 RepID=UPI001E5310AD|nr:NUDIX hydrolase [Subtercola endophyticus]UFS59645.1 NUDIX hydrolase [Subtercola endophyticus]
MAEAAESSPHSFVPPPRVGPRDSGDGWVEDGTGRKFWGRFGAAGLLAFDGSRASTSGAGGSILLQHRANWSHFGGTWGLPGGAKHAGETAVDGAIREANEEAGVPTDALQLKFTSTLDLGFWSYTTVVVDVTEPFDAAVADAESIEIRWVPIDEVAALPLHPGFEAAWGELRAELTRPIVLVVDSANVVGSRPNGWWKDRLGATSTFAGLLQRRGRLGFSGESLGIGLARTQWWPQTVLVVEGQARGAAVGAGTVEAAGVQAPAVGGATVGETAGGATSGDAAGDRAASDAAASANSAHTAGGALRIVAAEHDGDQQIVDIVQGYAESRDSLAPRVFVVTADRELTSRVEALGASVRRPGWLWALLDELD